MTLCTERIRTLDDIRAFPGGSEAAEITPRDREAAYAFIERTLVRFRYHFGLARAGKGLVRAYLAKVTGYSGAQLTRLIAQQRRTGRIRDHRLRPPARPFATVCTTADMLLPAEMDKAFGHLSGPATKRILWHQCHVFGDKRFERLAEISNGHIYNLRGRRAYRTARTTFRATRGAPSPIGQRRRPRPEGLRTPPDPSRRLVHAHLRIGKDWGKGWGWRRAGRRPGAANGASREGAADGGFAMGGGRASSSRRLLRADSGAVLVLIQRFRRGGRALRRSMERLLVPQSRVFGL